MQQSFAFRRSRSWFAVLTVHALAALLASGCAATVDPDNGSATETQPAASTGIEGEKEVGSTSEPLTSSRAPGASRQTYNADGDANFWGCTFICDMQYVTCVGNCFKRPEDARGGCQSTCDTMRAGCLQGCYNFPR